MARTLEDSLGWAEHGAKLVHEGLAGLDEDGLSGASALPGWSRRHVTAHLAANADAVGNLVRWAATGERTPMYSSPEQRAADIETGSTRTGDELRTWFDASAARLSAAMGALTPEQWASRGRHGPGPHRACLRDALDAGARGDGARRRPRHRHDLRRPAVRLPGGPGRRHRREAFIDRRDSGPGPAVDSDARPRWHVAGPGEPVTVVAPWPRSRPTSPVADRPSPPRPRPRTHLPAWL